ncbi:unnamed protein product [Vitrella brassicaformis CCMP3155]|uniref:VTT domain-containing protein n=1 Tax=Vitrella brassicaformis (strain CCMP3155) TaxID=1169540 RepID=A0A0G4EY60_VITBC|nr:unnamed protein product [Vitrella brassicaformis CCMP3155]|mmetsp:Transcript_6924/g.16800  ORF Transcript_6924/g.16800 Transcript_6924/m.16800 type:complete len:336 (-) Transcript_6924:10-1017(-)|eukprot:CEM03564.1 unnamed protein product [Vitrella brassicaformis CCMP3155]
MTSGQPIPANQDDSQLSTACDAAPGGTPSPGAVSADAPVKPRRTWGGWLAQSWKKLLVFLVIIAIIVYIIIDSTTGQRVAEGLDIFKEWVQDNPATGILAYMAVYMVCTVAFIPGSILTLGAGFTFVCAFGNGPGMAAGIGAVLVGAFVGAQLAFFCGRFLFKSWVQGLTDKFKVMRAIDKVFETQGLKLNILLRLSPVVPFSAFNYIMGGTRTRYRDYAIGTLGIIPGTALYVYIGAIPAFAGACSGKAEGSGHWSQWVFLAVGLVATFIAVFIVTWFARKALREITEKEAAEASKADGKEGVETPGPDLDGATVVTVTSSTQQQQQANGQAYV